MLQRIAMITPEFYPEINGVSRAYYEWLQVFLKRGVEVLFISPDYSEHPVYRDQAQSELQSLKECRGFYSCLFPIRPLAKGGNFYSAPKRKSLWNIDSCLEKFKPQLITCEGVERFNGFMFGWDGYGEPAGVSYGKTHKVPVVSIFQTDYFKAAESQVGFAESLLLPMGRKYWSRIHNSYDEVLTHSPCYQDALAGSLGIKNVKRVPFIGFDHAAFRERPNVSRSSETVEILYVGRVSADKNVNTVIEAVRQCYGRRRVRLSIVGSGPDEAGLKKSLQGAPFVHFHGWKTGDQLLRHYYSADLYVSPSPSETFGLATLEAMSCGLPVIGANSGHTPALVDEGTSGYLFHPKCPEDLCEKIERLCENPLKIAAFGRAGAEKAKSHPSWDSAGAALLDHLQQSRKALVQ